MKQIVLLSLIFITFTLHASVTRVELEAIFSTLTHIYKNKIPEGEAIRFNPDSGGNIDWWDYNMWRGAYVGYFIGNIFTHNVYIMGGIPKRNFTTVDGIALIACHEIGHGLGGIPQQVATRISTEGQSDYYSTSECLKEFFIQWPSDRSFSFLDPKIKDLCRQESDMVENDCFRAMVAINERVQKFKEEGATVSILTSSEEIADTTNLTAGVYPSYQCRVDIYVAGLLGHPRPRCWFAD